MAFASVLFSCTTMAAQADQVQAKNAWIRLLPGDLPAAGYVVLQNDGASTAMLSAVQSRDYASAMIHRSSQDAKGMSHMSMVDQLPIPAHESVSLSPNGYHLMLEHADHAIKPGDSVAITLRFADGSYRTFAFLVRPANAVDTN